MSILVTGYLTEQKLAFALQEILGCRWGGSQLRIQESRRRWDMWFTEDAGRVVVEYDGDEHYRNTLKIKIDNEKDAIANEHKLRVVRIPYWLQLDTLTLKSCIGLDAEIEQDFPHGFVTTKVFPASFCEMGIDRFLRELDTLPVAVRNAVIQTLRDRSEEHGIEYVVPAVMRDLVFG
jgi:hypothetical protein